MPDTSRGPDNPSLADEYVGHVPRQYWDGQAGVPPSLIAAPATTITAGAIQYMDSGQGASGRDVYVYLFNDVGQQFTIKIGETGAQTVFALGVAELIATDPFVGELGGTLALLPAGVWWGFALAGPDWTTPTLTDSLRAVVPRFVWNGAAFAVAPTTADVPTTAAIADAVLDEALSGHASAGTAGAAISDASLGAGTPTDIDLDPVPTGRRIVLVESPTLGLVGEATEPLVVGTARRMSIDFRNDMAANQKILTVGTPTINTGTEGGVTMADLGRDHTEAKITFTPVTAGTYIINVPVNYTGSIPAVGRVTFKVIN